MKEDAQEIVDEVTKHSLDRSPIRFLGMCERARQREFSWDFIGVTQSIALPFFPQSLSGLAILIAVEKDWINETQEVSYRITLTDLGRKNSTASTDQRIALGIVEKNTGPPSDSHSYVVPKQGVGQLRTDILIGRQSIEQPGTILLAYPAPPLYVWEPTRVRVDVKSDSSKWVIGEFDCSFRQPLPLSLEERCAIAARPDAPQAMYIQINCKRCGQSVKLVSRLEANRALDEGEIPVEDAPDQWECDCQPPRVTDLSYVKRGFHDTLRHHDDFGTDAYALGYTPLYETGRISTLIGEYESLIRSSQIEEEVQKFLENNPVFWLFLAPDRIVHKPSILTTKKADFAVLGKTGILYFVEIAKPTTQLTTKSGTISAEINKEANQILDWQGIVKRHRGSLLAELGFREAQIQQIRYILIGGLSSNETPLSLSKLREGAPPQTDFYCFDELVSFLRYARNEFKRL